MPEILFSRKLCQKARQRGIYGFACTFTTNLTPHVNAEKNTVTVNRTLALDSVKEAVIMRSIILPKNAREIDGFYDQLSASVRVYDDARGAYFWSEGSKADHYLLATCYALLAKKVMVGARI